MHLLLPTLCTPNGAAPYAKDAAGRGEVLQDAESNETVRFLQAILVLMKQRFLIEKSRFTRTICQLCCMHIQPWPQSD